jgi:hypothetical protein
MSALTPGLVSLTPLWETFSGELRVIEERAWAMGRPKLYSANCAIFEFILNLMKGMGCDWEIDG